ncbi:MAG: hypothetical protein ABI670_01110 [Chloroflexota bacterium]
MPNISNIDLDGKPMYITDPLYAEIARRTPEWGEPPEVGPRDLERYYALLQAERARLREQFSAEELMALCIVLHGSLKTPTGILMLWADVEDGVLYGLLDADLGTPLVEKVKALDNLSLHVLVDAIEIFLVNCEPVFPFEDFASILD